MGKHDHSTCDHNLKYCKHCDVAYCTKCDSEWRSYPYYYWTYSGTGTTITTNPPTTYYTTPPPTFGPDSVLCGNSITTAGSLELYGNLTSHGHCPV